MPRHKKFKDGVLQPGDVVLTTSREPISRLIRIVSFGNISHAMVCVSPNSVIDATSEGVYSRNTQRLLLDATLPARAFRLRQQATPIQLTKVITFVRSRVGTQYTMGGAAQSVIGGGSLGPKQFCSRLVAQAFANAGILLVDEPDYCYPSELARSQSMEELFGITEIVGDEELAGWDSLVDAPAEMRRATNEVLDAARAIDPSIQTLCHINKLLNAHPEHDVALTAALHKSEFLTVWQLDAAQNGWQYDVEEMQRVSVDVEEYCRQAIRERATGPSRFVVCRGGFQALVVARPLQYFHAMFILYDQLVGMELRRVAVAVEWLARRGLTLLNEPELLLPHTPEWFTVLFTYDPLQAQQTSMMIRLSGGDTNICSVCGDDEVADYALEDRASAAGPGSLRLCDECLQIRLGMGEVFVPFPAPPVSAEQ